MDEFYNKCDKLREMLDDDEEWFIETAESALTDDETLGAMFAVLCENCNQGQLAEIQNNLLEYSDIKNPNWMKVALESAVLCSDVEIAKKILKHANITIGELVEPFESDDGLMRKGLLKDIRINPRLALKEELMQKVWAPGSQMTAYFMNENDEC